MKRLLKEDEEKEKLERGEISLDKIDDTNYYSTKKLFFLKSRILL